MGSNKGDSKQPAKRKTDVDPAHLKVSLVPQWMYQLQVPASKMQHNLYMFHIFSIEWNSMTRSDPQLQKATRIAHISVMNGDFW